MGKTALIVDDSHTARVVLKRMLETHSLAVDTAESAELALDYLNDNRPDVIFMDHMMPGMDGLEAVKAIKNNPDTATIPIMMYTSQKGEVYVGQARALGAVGVLPKEVEPVEVSKMLASLRVIDSNIMTDTAEPAVDPVAEDVEPTGLDQVDLNIRVLIQDLFEQQRSIIRRDLLDSYETIATRVVDEIRTPVETDETRHSPVPQNKWPIQYQVAVGTLALLVVILGFSYWQHEQSLTVVRQQNDDLVKALERQNTVDEESVLEVQQRLDGYQQSLGETYGSALSAIEWGINQSAAYHYGEIPLGDRRLASFGSALEQLRELGFSGQVRIDLHAGDFCLTRAGPDGAVLAMPDLPVTSCDQRGSVLSDELDIGQQQSVSFANFLDSSTQETSGQIRFQIVSHGNREPLVDYPVSDAGISAGIWNAVAAENHRIEVTLFSD